MPKLILIRGNSGSGKTTLAKTLQHKFGHGTLLISQDVVRREMLYVKDGPDTRAIGLLQNLLSYGYHNCETVIMEGILRASWYKPLFESALEKFGKNIFAYYYDLPFVETLKRHQSKPNKNEFGEELMRTWWREKDTIGFIKETMLSAEITLQQATDIIYADATKTP